MSSPLPSLEAKDNVFVVKLKSKDVGEPNIESFGEQLVRMIDEMQLQRVELDLSEVDSISSTELANVMTLYKKVKAAGGHLTFKNVDDLVYQIFERTHLDKIFDIHRKGSDHALSDETAIPRS